MKLLAVVNPENAVEEEISKFKLRQAARAVVFDRDGRVALLNVSKKNYHKLPGGGIEAGESVLDALKRECREEIGCEIEVMGEIGEIVEYLKMFNINQTSFCYMAKLVGEKGEPAFMPDEIEDGFILFSGLRSMMLNIFFLPRNRPISGAECTSFRGTRPFLTQSEMCYNI